MEKKYAGFLIRLGAFLIDSIILSLLAYLFFGNQSVGITDNNMYVQFNGRRILVPIIYMIFFRTRKSATPGKILLGLKIVDKEGNPITLPKAILRYVGYFISGIVLFLGFIRIAFDEKKQGFHDKIAGTYVVKK